MIEKATRFHGRGGTARAIQINSANIRALAADINCHVIQDFVPSVDGSGVLEYLGIVVNDNIISSGWAEPGDWIVMLAGSDAGMYIYPNQVFMRMFSPIDEENSNAV